MRYWGLAGVVVLGWIVVLAWAAVGVRALGCGE